MPMVKGAPPPLIPAKEWLEFAARRPGIFNKSAFLDAFSTNPRGAIERLVQGGFHGGR